MAGVKTAILISGRGSNMAALVSAAEQADYPAEIALVLSNIADAPGLAHADGRGISTMVVDHREFDDRAAFEERLTEVLEDHKVELVCLAGFMRLLTETFVDRWRDHVINIHPSLLPGFKGLNTHDRALAGGVRIHGATVHYVRPNMDEGPIIVQAAVPVLEGDTSETLGERVLAMEHRIYPIALAWVASGRARIVGERVVLGDVPKIDESLIYPPFD